MREPLEGPHHPASPPRIDDEAERFARTLRDVIQSLPGRPGSVPSGTPAPAHGGIFGVATPTFDDQPADGRRAESGQGDSAGDSITLGMDRLDSSTAGRHESETSPRTDLGRVDRRDEVVAIPSAAPPLGGHEGDLSGHPASDRSREPVDGFVIGPASSGAQSGSFAVEATTAGIASGAFATAVDPYSTLGTAGFSLDRASSEVGTQDGDPRIGPPSGTVAIGPIGPAGRPDESFDRAPSPSASAAPWSGSTGGDPFAAHLGFPSAAGEGQAGADLNQTNALLGQILDELRRNQQQAPIASGRSVYPER